jgi:hypothetical protein
VIFWHAVVYSVTLGCAFAAAREELRCKRAMEDELDWQKLPLSGWESITRNSVKEYSETHPTSPLVRRYWFMSKAKIVPFILFLAAVFFFQR